MMEKLSHAYIIASPSPEAGLSEAKSLAAKMLCTAPNGRPCGVCRDCRKVMSAIHPDVTYIARLTDEKGTRKSGILIDQIRQMRVDASVLPNEAAGKVYIIEEADTMNERAQNAALKLLEEPPAGVAFILVTSNPDKLLITVRSRCTLLHRSAADVEIDSEMVKLADEYISCVLNGSRAELTAWCMENEKLDAKRLPDFLHSVKGRLVETLRYSDGKKGIMDMIGLIDRCMEYQAVNTSVKHIFGLLAVRSLPAAETRKKID